MAHSLRFNRLFLALISSAALGLAGLGCTTEVSGGDDGDGGNGGGGGSGGGSGECQQFTGAECTPNTTRNCFGTNQTQTCVLVQGCETAWGECMEENSTSSTPLVLSFEGGAVEYGHDAAHGFDLDGTTSRVTDWPTARTPWLAFDRDQSGAIEDGHELFGSLSPLPSGSRAPNGFIALRALDENHDGRITAEDPAFSRLLVWTDRDGDRLSKPGELASLSSFEVISIDLGYSVAPRCDARGNCEMERASFRFRDASGVEREGAVIDVHLAAQR